MHFYSFISYPKLLDQQFAVFTCSWSRWKWTLIFIFLFTFQIGALKILKEISRNCIIRKAIADLGGEEGPRASWSFQGEIVSYVAVICLFMQRFYVREACSVTAPVSEALWWRGRKRKESLQLRFWKLNGSFNSPVAPCWLSDQISANQHFASTFSMQIFK